MMVPPAPGKAQVSRWRDTIIDHLSDFPRQYAALENAMSVFGDNFDLQAFKVAFDATEDMDAYNRAQAVERAVGRVQNYVADLAIAAVKVAGLETSEQHASAAVTAFRALRDAKVVKGSLCRSLVRAHEGRRRIEHSYVKVKAGDVHRVAELVHASARDFIRAYRPWIEPTLGSADPDDEAS
jgi:uncharacterized protein YutE (UPF0331/DUF86 family)